MSRNKFPGPAPVEIQDKGLRIAWFILGLLLISIVVAIRIRLLGLPLERDEGEYAYAGQLMLNGIPPYQLAYSMKFPGTDAVYALIMSIFGQTTAGIHLGLLVVNIATVAIIFILGRRLIDSITGIAAAASYAVFSASPSVLGLAAHATHFVMLAVLSGALLLLHPAPSKKVLFVTGLLFGVAVLMKQPAIFFIPFGAAYLFYRDYRDQLGWKSILLRSSSFLGGSALPLAITCLLLWRAGVFARFWFWTVSYARDYGSVFSLSEGIQRFFNAAKPIAQSALALWILATLGLIVSFASTGARRRAIFLCSLLTPSVLALCSGFYFRPHYFILILPGISLLVGAVMAWAVMFCARFSRLFHFVPLLLFGLASSLPLVSNRAIFFAPDSVKAARLIYGGNPFPEAVKIAEYLREHTSDDDRIAILGSEPEIYFYSHRRSASGYIYTYELMEPQRYARQMQSEMIREIEAARPEYLVFVGIRGSWLQRADSDTLIFDWFTEYSAQNFQMTGLVNITSLENTEFYLPIPPNQLPQLSEQYLVIYKRKT